MSDKETKERIEKEAIALDFPEWIKSKEGEDCLKWPISEVKYLHNRLFWAFDAGRNCVWDQYIAQKSELQKAKELNGELVKAVKEMKAQIQSLGYYPECLSHELEALIKKSEI